MYLNTNQMDIVKLKRTEHIKYGLGWIIKDVEGVCKAGEVIFKPDEGIYDRGVSGHHTHSHWTPASYDIVNEKELSYD